MQLIRSFDQDNAALVGFGIRVMLLSKQSQEGPLARRLAGAWRDAGALSQEMYEALEAVIEDPAGYGLFVLDCDDVRRDRGRAQSGHDD
ncbi:MAG: hypothetical protein V9G14_09640, partial [Cypionkella sp.]